MKKIFLMLMLFFMSGLSVAAKEVSKAPEGLWKTIDDNTGKQKGIVKLWITEDKKLMGKIINFLPSPGHDIQEVCVNCQGEQHNQPILGLVFLQNLTQDSANPKKWVNGTILDPKNGKVYRCQITISDDDQTLNVRGYIGFPIIGRTQEWFRTTNTKFES